MYPWWALSIRDFGKPAENRGWRPPEQMIGERIAIHAGVRQATKDDLDSWLGTIEYAGRAWILGGRLVTRIDPWERDDRALLRAAIAEVAGRVICTARLVGVDRDQRTPWDVEGQWHWRLADVERVEGQPPVKGQLGLWDWQPDGEVERG